MQSYNEPFTGQPIFGEYERPDQVTHGQASSVEVNTTDTQSAITKSFIFPYFCLIRHHKGRVVVLVVIIIKTRLATLAQEVSAVV